MAFVQKMNRTKLASINCLLNIYEAQVSFRIRVRDSAIFEKIGCRCSGVQRLKNYYLYFLYIIYMSLVHKTKKEEGKKHKTKKKIQKK